MPEGDGYEWLRHSAGMHYVTNLGGLSIRELNQIPPYDQVGQSTLERWSVEDEWLARRQRYFAEITAEAEKRLQEKVVRARVRSLARTEEIATQIADEIAAGTVEAKSKEGLITALVRLLGLNEELRDKIAAQVVPTHLGGVSQETIPVTPKLSPEEARAAASAIIQQRRNATRQRLDAERRAGEGEPEKKPKLRVVKGESDA